MTISTVLKNTAIELPEWCCCMPWDWDGCEAIPPACHSFNDSGNGYCKFCQHTEECHLKQPKIETKIIILYYERKINK